MANVSQLAYILNYVVPRYCCQLIWDLESGHCVSLDIFSDLFITLLTWVSSKRDWNIQYKLRKELCTFIILKCAGQWRTGHRGPLSRNTVGHKSEWMENCEQALYYAFMFKVNWFGERSLVQCLIKHLGCPHSSMNMEICVQFHLWF